MSDNAYRSPGQQHGMHHRPQLAARHHKIGLGLRQRNRLSKSERHLGASQYRAIIEAIADHRHAAAGLLRTLQKIELVLRRAGAGMCRDPQCLGHPGHCLGQVARQQVDRDASSLQGLYGSARIRSQVFLQIECGEPALGVSQEHLQQAAHWRCHTTERGRTQTQVNCRTPVKRPANPCCHTATRSFCRF